jgi:hypothetical protein
MLPCGWLGRSCYRNNDKHNKRGVAQLTPYSGVEQTRTLLYGENSKMLVGSFILPKYYFNIEKPQK